MNNKLAVLISGRYRNFDETWPANKVILDSLKIPYEIFFHTWSENPNTNLDFLKTEYANRFYFSFYAKKYSDFNKKMITNKIERDFSFRSVQISEFKETKIAKEFNLGNSNTNKLYRVQLNSCGMYLGIDATIREMLKDSTYTHFLRLRTDFILDISTIRALFDFDLAFYGQLLPAAEGPVGDQCYGGSLVTARFMLETLPTLKKITSGQDWNLRDPVALGENIIRITLKHFRGSVRIGYFNGSGLIERPKIIKDLDVNKTKFFCRVLRHNVNVFSSKLWRVTKLGSS